MRLYTAVYVAVMAGILAFLITRALQQPADEKRCGLRYPDGTEVTWPARDDGICYATDGPPWTQR